MVRSAPRVHLVCDRGGSVTVPTHPPPTHLSNCGEHYGHQSPTPLGPRHGLGRPLIHRSLPGTPPLHCRRWVAHVVCLYWRRWRRGVLQLSEGGGVSYKTVDSEGGRRCRTPSGWMMGGRQGSPDSSEVGPEVLPSPFPTGTPLAKDPWTQVHLHLSRRGTRKTPPLGQRHELQETHPVSGGGRIPCLVTVTLRTQGARLPSDVDPKGPRET